MAIKGEEKKRNPGRTGNSRTLIKSPKGGSGKSGLVLGTTYSSRTNKKNKGKDVREHFPPIPPGSFNQRGMADPRENKKNKEIGKVKKVKPWL